MGEGGRKRRHAAAAVRRVVEADTHLPLLDAIAASPDDLAPWSVYADLLQTTGHPRGELISLMMERERRPSARLFDAQRRQLGLHAPALLPSTLGHDRVMGWRRGFVSEVRLDAPKQLAEVANDVSLRFVEAATIVIDKKRGKQWRAALLAKPMPMVRRLRVEVVKLAKLELAPILAWAPNVETLRIEIAAGAEVELQWDDARGARLKMLALVNAGEVGSLDEAKLPRLEELRLLGSSVATDELVQSLHWNRLERSVTGDDVARMVGSLSNAPGEDDEYYDEYYDEDNPPDLSTRTTAFVVIAQPVDPVLLRKLASRMSIAHLSARVCVARWLPLPVTVMQFFGAADADLLPYGLAVALQNVLDAAPPIALVEVDAQRATRWLVLAGDNSLRGTQPRADDAVRRALDLALGHDAGSTVVQDLLDELAATPMVTLLGNGGTQQLTMIDPSTAPLVVLEEPPDYDDDDDYGEDDDYYDEDDQAELYEEPPPLFVIQAEEASEAEAPAVVEAPIIEDVIEEDEDLEIVPQVEDEDALVPPPERVELWLDFRDHWDDRAIAIDDESTEIRWPDPERVTDLEAEMQVAIPSCAVHIRALQDCRFCEALHCPECGGEDYCSACFATIVQTVPLDEKRAS